MVARVKRKLPPVYEMATEKSACHWHSPRVFAARMNEGISPAAVERAMSNMASATASWSARPMCQRAAPAATGVALATATEFLKRVRREVILGVAKTADLVVGKAKVAGQPLPRHALVPASGQDVDVRTLLHGKHEVELGTGLLEDGAYLSAAHEVANHTHVGLNHGAILAPRRRCLPPQRSTAHGTSRDSLREALTAYCSPVST